MLWRIWKSTIGEPISRPQGGFAPGDARVSARLPFGAESSFESENLILPGGTAGVVVSGKFQPAGQ